MRECSLRAQFAAASKVKTRDGRQEGNGKLRRDVRRRPSKVEKRHLRRVFGRAVSRAVEIERRLSERTLRSEFQRQLSAQKTRLESELAAKSKSGPAETETPKAPIAPMFRDEEIRKRDEYIATIKARLKTAYEEKRTAERDLEAVRGENERLSREVTTYKSQESIMRRSLGGGGGSEARKPALMASEFARALLLLDEVAIMGVDDRHRNILTELLLANKVVREIRCSIEEEEEEGQRVDLDDVENKLDRIVAASDHVDDPDPAAHPTLHAQLAETYSVVGALLNILMGTRGETTKGDLVRRIYGDKIQGIGAASGSSAAEMTTLSPTAPHDTHPLQTSSSHTDATTTPPPNNTNTAPLPAPLPPSQDGAGDMDAATAHALQGVDDFDPDAFDFGSIDWSDPAWLTFDPSSCS